MPLGGPELELRVARRPNLQQRIVAPIVELEARDRLSVTAVEIFRESKHRREPPDDLAPLPAELPEVRVVARRRRAPVIPGDQRDRFDFVRFEPAQVAVLDQVVRVAVVTFVADVDAGVVQDGGVFEPLALLVGHPVNGARPIEERQRQPRNLVGMIGPVAAALGQLDDAAAAHVGIAIGLCDLLAVLRHVLEDEAFAQGQIAERNLLGAEPAEYGVDQDRARDREVRPPRLEAGHAKPLLQITIDERFACTTELFGRNTAVAQRGRCRVPALGERDGAEAQDGARRTDDAVEAGAANLIEILAELGVDELVQLAFIARRERIALDEPLGETDDAELEAASELHRGASAPRDLDTAPSDVDDDDVIAGRADAVRRGAMDEPCFLGAGDDARADAGLGGDGLEKLGSGLGFARRARRDGDDLIHAVRVGEPPELGHHLERGVGGFRGERAAVEAARAEPDHLFFAIDDFKRQIGPHPHDDHVQRICPDIDGGDAHWPFLL